MARPASAMTGGRRLRHRPAASRSHRGTIRLGRGATRFEALHDVDLRRSSRGEFVCLLGPSGCGKSTLLGALAGHVAAGARQLSVDGAPVAGPRSRARHRLPAPHAVPLEDASLDNVAFGLQDARRRARERARTAPARRCSSWSACAGSRDHYPAQLSGGMQQRVEIARVLINSRACC